MASEADLVVRLFINQDELSSVISLANGFGYLQSIPEYVLRGIYDKIVVNLMGDGKIFLVFDLEGSPKSV
ncbi:hypothetical protein [Streptococcus orisratti]|uniref:hypothetical protein n=1 Tax=Streptococcus orisratti TaxID=114652 RepID=UPI003D0703A1